MRDEVEHVLGRGVAAAWRPDRRRIAAAFERWAEMIEPVAAPGPLLRCRDPDDQMFIDLALSARAQWLVTRDRALLVLARRARLRGVTVIRPVDWPARPDE